MGTKNKKIVNNIVSNFVMWCISLILFILLSPLLLLLSLIILISDSYPVFFIQKRVGINGKVFLLWKFRTMKPGSLSNNDLKKLNEADGPVFKIKNDPRFYKFGKFLSHTGLDELPQFFNILKGEMTLIGPRPLPVDEVKKIDKKYKKRNKVLPGIISPWVLDGYHKLKFNEWMESDLRYIEKKNLFYDLFLMFKSFIYMVDILINEIVNLKRK